MKLDPSIKIGQCLNILVLLQNKCVLDARWPMESCAESSFGHFSSRSVGKICTSGKICQWSCVGFGYRLHTPIGTWYPRLPTLFGESMFSFIPRIWSMIDFMFIILISASQILWRNRPEIQVFQVSATSFSWCKDREESGVYPGWQCLGNVTAPTDM